jgi:hypothetical protein
MPVHDNGNRDYRRRVSFGTYARKVRDSELPFGRRVSALRSCVQMYRPIGFHATLSFIAEIAGPYDRDEAALLRALDALVASRERWKAELRHYATIRSAAKSYGQRSPRPGDPNPCFPHCWYGASRQAAVHALKFWSRDRLPILLAEFPDPAAQAVATCVDACIAAGGSLTPDERRVLASASSTLRRHLGRPGLWRDDGVTYFLIRDLLTVARHVEIAADTA